jgi:predicted N-acyltransferase
MNQPDIGLELISMDQVESITSIDPFEWDPLAGDNIFASYGWLRTIEETCKVPARHRIFMLRRDNELVAAAPCFFQYPNDLTITMDYILFGRFKRLAPVLRLTALPAMISGSRTGWHKNVFVKRELSPDLRTRVIEEIINHMELTARKNRSILFFRGVSGEEKELSKTLTVNRYPKTKEMPHTCLDIEWHTFQEYRRHLKKRHPGTEKSIRQEINRAKRGGLVVRRLENPASRQNDLHEIMDKHHRRLNEMPFPFHPHFFERLKDNLGDKAIVYVAEKGEELLGVLIMLQCNDTVFLPMIGVDRERSGREEVFFNLIFNQPIRDAIETGIKRIYYGKLLYDVKIRRGCRIIDNDLYVRARSPMHERTLKAIFRYHNWRIKRIIANISGDKIA